MRLLQAVCLVLTISVSSFAKRAPGDDRPNIFFWFPDETRAESMGTYGHPITKTPNYDALAAMGTKFNQAHVLHTQCSPSRCAMVTGRYMHVEGHRTQIHLVRPDEPNMFMALKNAGYTTVTFGKNDMFAAASFNQSFDYWINGDKGATDAAEAVKFLQEHGEDMEPWCLFNPTKGSHPPYNTKDGKGFPFGTAGYYSFYDNGSSIYNPEEIKAKVPLRPYGTPNKPHYYQSIVETRNLTSLDDDFFYKLNAVYLEHVTDTDTNFGEVMAQMKASNLLDRTAVFVSSDHGDFAGDHHMVEKWPGGMDDFLTHVPLIAYVPGMPAGRVVDAPVNLFDLLPTFADIAQTNLSFTHFAKNLMPMISGESDGDLGRLVFSEGGYLWPTEQEPLNGGAVWTDAGEDHQLYWPRSVAEMEGCTLTPETWRSVPSWNKCFKGSPRAVMVRNATHKLVYRKHGVSELYDMVKDPREMTNLYGSAGYMSIQQELESELLKWYVTTGDVTPLKHDPRGLPAKPSSSAATTESMEDPSATPPAPADAPARLRGRRGGRAPGDTRPNIILYHPDETRAESLGVYGHPITQTPNYKRLADRGTLFTQAHALHTQCAPSRCAMITGRYMHTMGHRTQTHLVQSSEEHLFKYMHDAGYYVQWNGKNDALAADAFNGTVDNWWEGPAIDKVVNFLESNPPEPFFLYIPTLGAHPPYRGANGINWGTNSTPGYYSMWNNGTGMYDPEDIKTKSPLRPYGVENKPKYWEGIPKYRNLENLDMDFFYRLNSVYLTMVTDVDTYLGSVLDALDKEGLTDTTAFFTSSDHGDFSGDAKLVEKWPGGMDDMLTRVPLIASIPGGKAGQVVDSAVNIFDLLPTFVELAGSRVNHTQWGVSLVDVIKGTAEADPSRMVYSEGGFLWPTEIEPLNGACPMEYDNQYWPRSHEELEDCILTPETAAAYPNYDGCHGSPRVVMARNSTHKLVYRPNGVSELYDMVKDPRELNNVWGTTEYADLQTEMLAGLLEWFSYTIDVTPLTTDPRGFPPDKRPPSSSVDDSPVSSLE